LGDDAGDVAKVSFTYFDEGDEVEEGEDLIEMVTDKATFNVPCPQTGAVRKMLVSEDDEVKVGDAICILEV
jgi:pyruvate dehydrogenase E2 component (dihydrolipoamide acetyltransferase)